MPAGLQTKGWGRAGLLPSEHVNERVPILDDNVYIWSSDYVYTYISTYIFKCFGGTNQN